MLKSLFLIYYVSQSSFVQHEGGYGFAEFDEREDAKDAVKVFCFCYISSWLSLYIDGSLFTVKS